MHDWDGLSHVRWDCKYHIVIVPKYRRKRVKGLHFWSRGYCVSTVGLDEGTIREYIRKQEELEKRQIEMELE